MAELLQGRWGRTTLVFPWTVSTYVRAQCTNAQAARIREVWPDRKLSSFSSFLTDSGGRGKNPPCITNHSISTAGTRACQEHAYNSSTYWTQTSLHFLAMFRTRDNETPSLYLNKRYCLHIWNVGTFHFLKFLNSTSGCWQTERPVRAQIHQADVK